MGAQARNPQTINHYELNVLILKENNCASCFSFDSLWSVVPGRSPWVQIYIYAINVIYVYINKKNTLYGLCELRLYLRRKGRWMREKINTNSRNKCVKFEHRTECELMKERWRKKKRSKLMCKSSLEEIINNIF